MANDGTSRGNSPVGDLPPLEPPRRSPREEFELDAWARGWDACFDYLWPLLQRAEHDADVWYKRANPDEIDRRLDEHFRREWERFAGKDGS